MDCLVPKNSVNLLLKSPSMTFVQSLGRISYMVKPGIFSAGRSHRTENSGGLKDSVILSTSLILRRIMSINCLSIPTRIQKRASFSGKQ